ncbi:MAG TPA: GNAT family N-acetyltransferase [Longimicrobiales bacterium]
MRIGVVGSEDELRATWPVMRQLRPHLAEDDYVVMVRSMADEGYRVAAGWKDGRVVAVAGFRFMTMLYAGRLLYVDDLVTDEAARSAGLGRAMIDWLKEQAVSARCSEIQLISHVRREAAHRFYFREGFGIECFEFRWRVAG